MLENLKWIGKTKISRNRGKNYNYALLRISNRDDIVGKIAQIYDLKVQDKQGFLIVVSDEPLANLKDIIHDQELYDQELYTQLKEIEERLREHERAIREIYNLISRKK